MIDYKYPIICIFFFFADDVQFWEAILLHNKHIHQCLRVLLCGRLASFVQFVKKYIWLVEVVHALGLLVGYIFC